MERERLADLVDGFEDALEEQDPAAIDRFREALEQFLTLFEQGFQDDPHGDRRRSLVATRLQLRLWVAPASPSRLELRLAWAREETLGVEAGASRRKCRAAFLHGLAGEDFVPGEDWLQAYQGAGQRICRRARRERPPPSSRAAKPNS